MKSLRYGSVLLIGLALAADDDVGYRRVLHILRLEYDTRLGMVRIAPLPLINTQINN